MTAFVDRIKQLVAKQPIVDLLPGGAYKILNSRYWRVWCHRCGEPIRVPWCDTQKACFCRDCDPMITKGNGPCKADLMVPWQLEKLKQLSEGS